MCGTYLEVAPLSYNIFIETESFLEIDEKETFWKTRLFLPFWIKNACFGVKYGPS